MLNVPKFNKYQLTEYLSESKSKDRQQYLRLWWEKNKQEYNLKRRQKYATKKAKKQSLLEQLTHQHQTKTNYSCSCPEDKYCNNCWFFDQQGNFVDYKTNQKSVGEKSVGEKSLHTRSSLTIARNKELVFFCGRELLTKRLDKEEMRLATKDKKPLKCGWNQSWFKEWLSKDKLLDVYQEWSIKGGKRMGNKFLSFLDLDILKEDMSLSLQQRLKKNVLLDLNYLDCFHVETKKGYHVYMLSDELLPNEILYHTDKFGKRRKIGSIQSKGKYVVGFDSVNKKLVEKGKWFWHVKDLAEVKGKLGKFFIEVGKEKREEKPVSFASDGLSDVAEKIEKQLDYKLIEENLKLKDEVLNKSTQNLFKTSKQIIQAKILSKQKIPWLTDFIKIWYKNLNAKQNIVSYFLLNDYQYSEILPSLNVGSVKTMLLVNGQKHAFFGGMRL